MREFIDVRIRMASVLDRISNFLGSFIAINLPYPSKRNIYSRTHAG